MSRAKTKNPNDFDPIVVNGSLVEPHTVYEVVAKEPSKSSPEVYKQMGSVKERIPGVSNTVSLSQGNTGFFDDSPSFNKIDSVKNNWSKRAELADKYYEIFASPMRNYIPEIDRIRVPTDDEFFDRVYKTGYLTVTIGEGAQFNTANPVERFKLYIALQEGELAMKGKRTKEEREEGLKDEDDIYNQDAQYAYVSITDRKSKKEHVAEQEMEASYFFGQMLRSEKPVLLGMLSYLSIPAKADASTAELNTLYKTKIESNRPKMLEFLQLSARYEESPKQMKGEFELLELIRSKKGREMITKDGSTFYYKDTILGSNYKSAVSTLLKPENEDVLKDFYLNIKAK